MPPFPAPYHAMTPLADAARPRTELWRTLAGLLLSGVVAVVLVIGVGVPLVAVFGPAQVRQTAAQLTAQGTPLGVIGLLFSFLPQMLGLLVAVALLMRRPPQSLTGPIGPATRNFVRVALPLLALWLVMLPFSILGQGVTQNLTLVGQLPWLPVALTGLLVQTATEELLFRGYLQQQLAARFAARWVWLGVPSVLFGLAHYAPQDMPGLALLTVLWAGLFGLAAADLTARTGNLGAALALHFTNNIAAILWVSYGGNIDGLALFTVALDPANPSATLVFLALDAVCLGVGWLLARVALRV